MSAGAVAECGLRPAARARTRGRSERRQFAVNLGSNLGLFGFNVLVNMALVRFMIGRMGLAAYGLVPLATAVTSWFGLLTLSLNGATGRYLAIELEQGRRESAVRTFNTALLATAGMALLAVPLGGAVVVFLPRLFQIPAGQETEARVLFALAFLAFVLTAVGSGFGVSNWVRNRFDLRNLVNGIGRAVQAGGIVAAFALLGARVWQVGFGLVAAAAVVLTGSVVLWRRLTPELVLAPASFDRGRLGRLVGLGGWMLANQVGAILLLSIDLLVVNRFFGPEAGGRYGALLQVPVLLRTFATMVAGVLVPTVLHRYARGDAEGVRRLGRRAVRLMGILLALPVGLVCGLAGPFLRAWLGPGFAGTAGLLVLMVAPLGLNLAVIPLFGIQVSHHRVRWPGIVTLAAGVANLGLAVALASWGQMGMAGVALAGAVILTLKNALFTTLYGARFDGSRWWSYLVALVPGLVGAALLAAAGRVVLALLPGGAGQSSVATGLVAVGLGLGYAVAAWRFGLRAEDRALLPRVRGKPAAQAGSTSHGGQGGRR
ncbi:MAG TPA: polysaccharide biosynthesis protein [candidate division WOR-3 bacterium]|uniref:Polysaccharide biosynthesis protein n=1 Tax=candidate division WOR-3 bacterium TaxID=2052148 RepID=A0A7V0XFP6_UNCW3|nr:polysaccharide biosynthesis protein [candidate division WOR-3 bacterium]